MAFLHVRVEITCMFVWRASEQLYTGDRFQQDQRGVVAR